MQITMKSNDSEAIRRRLIAIRKLAVGDNQREFARLLEISANRWNNLERGWPLTFKVANMIIQAVEGITIEYIHEGATGRVPAQVKRKLQVLEAELHAELDAPPPSSRRVNGGSSKRSLNR